MPLQETYRVQMGQVLLTVIQNIQLHDGLRKIHSSEAHATLDPKLCPLQAGWRGEKGMFVLLMGGVSVYITFQLFGLLPASQSSLHRYTDMEVVPAEGMMEPQSP